MWSRFDDRRAAGPPDPLRERRTRRAGDLTARSAGDGANLVTLRAPARGALMSETPRGAAAPVVLVHGAFADASSWNGVITRLLAEGVPVTAPANPLRGIAVDSAYAAAVLEQIEGTVVLV